MVEVEGKVASDRKPRPGVLIVANFPWLLREGGLCVLEQEPGPSPGFLLWLQLPFLGQDLSGWLVW